MKKLSLILVIALVAGGMVFAAGGNQQSGGASSGPLLIGIAMPETTVLRWVKDGASLKSEAEKRGYRAELQNANGDQV
ncbi:MAG: ABC transporter, partial [Treponema sp.]|nr:ABC transporter [Treponema sp.]